jgi:uncharacterized membrane protein YdjX (TVP38/TMEM64 family)
MNWKSFIIGMLIGLFIGLALFYELGERYEIRISSVVWPIKVDKWTGRTWMLGHYYGSKDKGDFYFWVELKDH